MLMECEELVEGHRKNYLKGCLDRPPVHPHSPIHHSISTSTTTHTPNPQKTTNHHALPLLPRLLLGRPPVRVGRADNCPTSRHCRHQGPLRREVLGILLLLVLRKRLVFLQLTCLPLVFFVRRPQLSALRFSSQLLRLPFTWWTLEERCVRCW